MYIKNIRLSIVAVLFAFNGLFSQQINPIVIASTGADFNNGNAQLSWTLGETVIETISGGLSQTFFLTQGFHQPSLAFSKINKIENLSDIKIYPNPTQTHLTIEFKDLFEPYHIEIYDILGRSLMSSKKDNDKNTVIINTEELANGKYLLKISSETKSNLSISSFIISN